MPKTVIENIVFGQHNAEAACTLLPNLCKSQSFSEGRSLTKF
ncbi:MAG: hypothetical protein SAL70_20350 [Scytonema sp. PMC 1070.18]|nr:hypothetical protein [Scytonema sp. PMC 1070.18]